MAAMSEDELRHHILNFLKDFKELMGESRYYIKDRTKNNQALKDLGINKEIQKKIIYSITLEDYSKGPRPDTIHGGDYWEFGKEIIGIEIYIKLKIITYNDGNEKAICYSFHRSEYPMEYLFRKLS